MNKRLFIGVLVLVVMLALLGAAGWAAASLAQADYGEPALASADTDDQSTTFIRVNNRYQKPNDSCASCRSLP